MVIKSLIVLALSVTVSALDHSAHLVGHSTSSVGSPATTSPSTASKFASLPAFPPLDNSASACLVISATGEKRCFPSGSTSIQPEENHFGFDYTKVDAIAIPHGSKFSLLGGPKGGSDDYTTSVDRQHNSSFFEVYDNAGYCIIFFTLALDPVVACLTLPADAGGDTACFGPGAGALAGGTGGESPEVVLRGGASMLAYTDDGQWVKVDLDIASSEYTFHSFAVFDSAYPASSWVSDAGVTLALDYGS